MDPQARIGLIIPSNNRMTEPQFHRYAPPPLGIHVTRLRMTGKWHRPLADLQDSIAEAAKSLSDAKPGVIVFHCTASSMEEGLAGDGRILKVIEDATGCRAITTGRAITGALGHLGIKKLVLISPYVAKTNRHEIRYLREAGFEVIHELGLGLSGSDEYIAVTARRWIEIVGENVRPEAEGYFLSCTNTTMIEAVDDLEQRLGKPVITSNQATLWACLREVGISQPTAGPGHLFRQSGKPRSVRPPPASLSDR